MEAIRGWQGWASARTIMGFLAIPGEPDLRDLFIVGLRGGKRLALPRVDWGTRSMAPALVRDLERDVMSGKHGLHEPAAACPPANLAEIDLVLVPGLAFDRAGHRLGRGGGFYDRFLGASGLRARVMGVAYEVQVVKEIPVEATDIPVEFLATEAGVRSAVQRA